MFSLMIQLQHVEGIGKFLKYLKLKGITDASEYLRALQVVVNGDQCNCCK